MEKNNKGMLYLVILLVVLVLGLGGYLVYDKVLTPNDNNNTTTTTTTTKATNVESNFIFEETFDYKLNNTNHKITYKYYYHKLTHNNNLDEMDINYGYYYSVSAITFMDGQKIEGSERTIYNSDVDETDYNKIKGLLTSTQAQFEDADLGRNNKYSFPLNENNLLTIKGSDKDYLVLSIGEVDDFYKALVFISPMIINGNGKVIFAGKTWGGSSFWYKNASMKKPYYDGDFNRRFYIDGNTLYYLNSECDEVNNKYGFYKYTITVGNDQVNIKDEEIDRELVNGAGEMC